MQQVNNYGPRSCPRTRYNREMLKMFWLINAITALIIITEAF